MYRSVYFFARIYFLQLANGFLTKDFRQEMLRLALNLFIYVPLHLNQGDGNSHKIIGLA